MLGDGVRGMSTDDAVEKRNSLATIVVEFGPLTPDQQAFVDLHVLRAVGTETPTAPTSDGVIVEFWVREDETPESLYDDIRGWAIGNRLPIRGLVEQ
jgi:hypothetical protein